MGGLPEPTIDWGDRTKKYIDSITGVLIQRVTGGADNFDDTNPISGSLLSPVIDVDNRGEWSNANNFVTNQASGTLASTTTTNAPLFAAINYSPPGAEYFSGFSRHSLRQRLHERRDFRMVYLHRQRPDLRQLHAHRRNFFHHYAMPAVGCLRFLRHSVLYTFLEFLGVGAA